jgi:hypothetical protein
LILLSLRFDNPFLSPFLGVFRPNNCKFAKIFSI